MRSCVKRCVKVVHLQAELKHANMALTTNPKPAEARQAVSKYSYCLCKEPYRTRPYCSIIFVIFQIRSEGFLQILGHIVGRLFPEALWFLSGIFITREVHSIRSLTLVKLCTHATASAFRLVYTRGTASNQDRRRVSNKSLQGDSILVHPQGRQAVYRIACKKPNISCAPI